MTQSNTSFYDIAPSQVLTDIMTMVVVIVNAKTGCQKALVLLFNSVMIDQVSKKRYSVENHTKIGERKFSACSH